MQVSLYRLFCHDIIILNSVDQYFEGVIFMYTVKINDRGQITIPKEVRDKADLKPKENLVINIDKKGRLLITKNDFFSDLEELIKRDLVNEGYRKSEVESMIPFKKKELGEALLKMTVDVQSEINNGHYSSLEDLKEEIEKEEK